MLLRITQYLWLLNVFQRLLPLTPCFETSTHKRMYTTQDTMRRVGEGPMVDAKGVGGGNNRALTSDVV